MNRLLAIACLSLVLSCVTDDSVPIVFENNILLIEDLENSLYQTDAVHAFAANNEVNDAHTTIYAFVENGASNIKFYETHYKIIHEATISKCCTYQNEQNQIV